MGLDSIEIVLEVEEQFSISIPDARASEVRTVGHLCDLARELVVAQRRPEAPLLGVETQVRMIVADQLGCSMRSISLESRFVEDLGC